MIRKFVTPELANHWLQTNQYEKQRQIRASHVEYLTQAILTDTFREGTVITFCSVGNKFYLVNGYHTLHAVVKSQRGVMLTIEEIEVPSLEKVASVYATFDRNLVRSHGDIYNAHNLASRLSLPKGAIKAYAAGVAILVTGFSDTQKDTRTVQGALLKNPEIRTRYMIEYQKEAALYFYFSKDTPSLTRKLLARGYVVAVGLATYRYAEHFASKFWSLLKEDSRLDKHHAAKALLTWLQSNPPAKYPDARYAFYVASCWNAFVEGRSLSKIYAKEPPMFLQNTPFNGKDVLNLI